MNELIELSWNTQFTLAVGYASYIVSYKGIRDHHTTLDIIFCTLVFGFFATSIMWLFRSVGWPIWAGAALSIPTTLVGALLWRSHGRIHLQDILEKSGIQSDDTPSAWKALYEIKGCEVKQISIETNDGHWLRCDDTSLFFDCPGRPVTLGADGGVLLYLTHTRLKGEEAKSQNSVIDKNYGSRLTYVPPSNIKRVNIRYKKLET
ncbi:hypothetical protein [Henriciella sp.]|uniref:hypothetical protein n=1 Tax=Henriciella sp. TaxID=1968823 RepID=UPI002610F9F0|nr:hypothetical protein [Henriciella sp.]